MRKLHLVGLTTDRDGLIFTARKGSKSGGYIVPLDDKLLAAIVQANEQGNGAPTENTDAGPIEAPAVPKRRRSESALTPREMQARLRAGRSIDEVAAEAGVDTEWVARFAVPILAEQAQVVELARALVYAKPRLGESTQPLGQSVLQNLSDRGVFLLDDVARAGWSAFQLHDSVWMVRFRYRSRGRDQEAQWEIDVPTGRLRARNRHASDLGYVGPERWETVEESEEMPVNGDTPAPAPARRRAPRAAAERTSVPKAAPPRRRAATARPVARSTKAVKAGTAPKARKAGTVAKGTRTRATKAQAPVVEKTARATPVKRRAAKAGPAADGGPAAGSGAVRMAVARVSTARVAASMAAAEREPWAQAVRRPPRAEAASTAGSAPTARASAARSAARRAAPAPEPVSSARRREPVPVRTFEPRPLPPPGQEPKEPSIRKVPAPRARRATEEPPAVSLPAKRVPAPRQESLPADRPKRRRLRSR